MLIVCFILGLVLIGIGAVMLVKPQFVYKLTEGWKHDGDVYEPSRLYLWSTRFGGVMFVLAGICGLILSFLPQ